MSARSRPGKALFILLPSFILLAMTAACGSGSQRPGQPGDPRPPELLRVTLTEALIAPVKLDGSPWDMGSTDTEAVARVVSDFAAVGVMSGEPVFLAVSAAAKAFPELAQGSVWPDVYGEAEMSPAIDDDPRRQLEAHAENNANVQLFAAESRRAVSWTVQPKNRPTMRVSLMDRDALNDDNIGVFVLSHEVFEEAWRAGEKLWVRVNDQTQNQILAVGIIAEEMH